MIYNETLLNGWIGWVSYKTIGRITILSAILNGSNATNGVAFRFNLTLSETYNYPNLPKGAVPFPVYNVTDNCYIANPFYIENKNYYMLLTTGKLYYINTAYINNNTQ